MQNNTTFSLSKELATSDFGDERLNARLITLTDSISRRPSDGFPQIAGSVGALEALYRFLGNSKVTPEKILSPHIEATVKRAAGEDRLIVAHDTTEFLFGGKSRKEELGWTKQGNQGFFAHFSLALSRTSFVRPLGVLGIDTIFRTNKSKKKKRSREEMKLDSDRESLRWWNSVHRVENLFPFGTKPIHVMDRGADDFDFFSDLISQDIRFVARVNHNRGNCQIIGEEEKYKLFELLGGLKATCKREVLLSKRESNRMPATRKRHPPREKRIATLQIAAAAIQFPKTKYSHSSQKTLTLNFVHVYEVDAPSETERVDWKLMTTEPIENTEQLFNIIDDYRARWTIEEYFKALKTGCSYEKRQLESQETLLNALAIFSTVAWQMLLLRTLNRHDPLSSAEFALTKTQIQVLKAVSNKNLANSLTIKEALLSVAALGWHIPNNGDPGWLVLARGMETLLTMEIAWTAATEKM